MVSGGSVLQPRRGSRGPAFRTGRKEGCQSQGRGGGASHAYVSPSIWNAAGLRAKNGPMGGCRGQEENGRAGGEAVRGGWKGLGCSGGGNAGSGQREGDGFEERSTGQMMLVLILVLVVCWCRLVVMLPLVAGLVLVLVLVLVMMTVLGRPQHQSSYIRIVHSNNLRPLSHHKS